MDTEALRTRQWNSTWDGLPREIQLSIFNALFQSGCTLGRLATVSRGWQQDIERYNFSQIRLTPARVMHLNRMTCRTQALVTCIWFCLELNRYGCGTSGGCVGASSPPRQPGQRPGDTSWATNVSRTDHGPVTKVFHDLFAALSTWKPRGYLKLDISVYSPSDSEHWFKYLTILPDADNRLNTLGFGEIEPTFVLDTGIGTFHDPAHGWVHGRRRSPPPEDAIFKSFSSVMTETKVNLSWWGIGDKWWGCLPVVPAVTSLLLRQQNRRRWNGYSLAQMLASFPGLQEFHYEPWREWDFAQKSRDKGAY
jgi:hypothetical protein